MLITSLIFTSCKNNEKANMNDSERHTYVVISQDGDGKKVDTYSLTSYEAKKMKQQDNILVVELDGYVTGSKKSNNNDLKVKKNFYKKDKQKKIVKTHSSKASNTEWNMQSIKLNTAVLEEDSFIQYDFLEKTVSGPAITFLPDIGLAEDGITVSGPAITLLPDNGLFEDNDTVLSPSNNYLPDSMFNIIQKNKHTPVPGIVKVAIIDSE